MRKSLLALFFCGFLGASHAVAGTSLCDAVTANLVANCGFETGDFTGWMIGGNSVDPGSPPNYFGVDTFDANSGNYGAYLSQDLIDGGTTPLTLSQTLVTTVGEDYTFDFWLDQDTEPATGYTHAFSATWGGSPVLSLTPTVSTPGTFGSFTEYSFMETATSTSTTVQFTIENDDNYWSLDDVSVAQVATPEPSTFLAGGMALGAFLILRARSRRRSV